jgi:hypothetical protein
MEKKWILVIDAGANRLSSPRHVGDEAADSYAGDDPQDD